MGSPWARKCCQLPERLVFNFLATPLQPQNRQIMNELECGKNVHKINVNLDIENKFRQPAALWRTWVILSSVKGRDLSVWLLPVGEGI